MRYDKIPDSPPVLKKFLLYLSNVKGRSGRTVYEYFLNISLFLRYLIMDRGMVSETCAFDDIDIFLTTPELLRTVTLYDGYAFLTFCKEEKNNSAKTRARKTSALRSFFKFLAGREGILTENPFADLDLPKLIRYLPKYLTLNEAKTLLECASGKFAKRDYCIITLFLNLGLRVSEMAGLSLSDIQGDGTVRIMGKGGKERILFLSPSCLKAVEDYLPTRPTEGVKDDRTALFYSAGKRRISVRGIQYIIKEYFEKMGLTEGYTTHKLRHTAATLMYREGGVDVLALKEILGHENVSVTQIYTHVGDAQIKEAVMANPLSEFGVKKGGEK